MAALRQHAILYAHELDERARTEDIDQENAREPPPIVGRAATHDPDTGEFKLE